MKKLVLFLAFAMMFTLSNLSAQTKENDSVAYDETKWTDLSYVNVPILKIMEAVDGYLIVYQKNRVGTGTVVIPKKWIKGNTENPRKLKIRNAKTSNSAYLTIVKKNNEFLRVIITTPLNKSNPIWGVSENRKGLNGADKDTLEELEL